ncbi:hypothetical protein NUU61_006787 [Penicillium alfredii]|uniref:Uncharacterized protein n=1 Tax=Penicillium alfredii TaxID=1506179 RepID=A0A9W9F1K3_9EURO|nr:uncharacterized protein NUU61_006787 [Penicillium alfredii]KAJ5091917.1 hypothetical protein NUU61_006787 [Penicillium alfredii]
MDKPGPSSCKTCPESSTPPLADTTKGIWINGVGDNAHEALMIAYRKRLRIFVKTAHKPYDLVVTCVLLMANLLAPNVFRLRSDGLWDEWQPMRDLYARLWTGEEIGGPPWEEDEEEEE